MFLASARQRNCRVLPHARLQFLPLPMTIAVNAILHPSRLLRLALLAFALCSCGAAACVLQQQARFHAPLAMALAAVGAGLRAAWAAWRLPNPRVLDISGLGELRLSVQQSQGAAADDAPLRLLPGSTVWRGLLLLLLGPAGPGPRTVLIILPDSVAPGQFRSLAVAARAIAGRDNKFLKNKENF